MKMNTLLFALNAILPIVLLIGLGYFTKKIGFLDAQFFINLNKFIFRLALPTLMFYNIFLMDSINDIPWSIILFVISMLLIVFFLFIPVVKYTVKNNSQKGVVLQGAFHTNALLIGVPLTLTLGNVESIAILAVSRALSLPLIIMLSVIGLSMFEKDPMGNKMSIRLLFKNVFTNPIIIAVLLGLSSLVIRNFIPEIDGRKVFSLERDVKFLFDLVKMISQTASPMALIALGGQFEIQAIKSMYKEITAGVLIRTVFVPAIILTTAYLLKDFIPGMNAAFAPLIALYATPIAVASVFMADEMKSDTKLAGQLVVWSTVFSMFSLYIIIAIFRFLGAL